MGDFVVQHAGAIAGAGLGALACVLFMLASVGLFRFCRARWRQRSNGLGQAGSVVVEFVIIIIPFLLTLFAVMQIALVSMARLMVSYAAFAAARAAIVVLPEGGGGGGGEGDNADATSHAASLARNAAAFALIPASPSLDALVSPKDSSVARALDAGWGATTGGVLGAVERSLRKLVYARLATSVELLDEQGHPKSDFAWNEPVRARVTYLFYCQIPMANRLAGKSFGDLPGGAVDGLSGTARTVLALIPGRFLVLTAEHTLVNQGKP